MRYMFYTSEESTSAVMICEEAQLNQGGLQYKDEGKVENAFSSTCVASWRQSQVPQVRRGLHLGLSTICLLITTTGFF